MLIMIEPGDSESEYRHARDDAGGDGVSEAGLEETEVAREEAGACRGEWIGDEEAAGGADKLCYASEALGAEDGESGCAFGQVEHHRGEAHDGAEEHADQDDGEGLEGKRNDGEGKRHGDVRTDRDELSCSNREDNFAEERVLKRRGAMRERQRVWESGLHAAIPFGLLRMFGRSWFVAVVSPEARGLIRVCKIAHVLVEVCTIKEFHGAIAGWLR
jgi:hypothetical protein